MSMRITWFEIVSVGAGELFTVVCIQQVNFGENVGLFSAGTKTTVCNNGVSVLIGCLLSGV